MVEQPSFASSPDLPSLNAGAEPVERVRDETLRRTASGSETRKRGHRPAMRCDDAELLELELRADRAGMTVGAYMRHQCLGAAGPRAVRTPPIDRATVAELIGHLGRIGSNLNQIARVLNTTGDERPGLPECINELRGLFSAGMRALGRNVS